MIPVAAPYVSFTLIFHTIFLGGYVDLCLRVKQKDYAAEITDRLSSLGLFADVDNGENTLPKKIRNGEIAQYNFILGLYKTASNISFTDY